MELETMLVIMKDMKQMFFCEAERERMSGESEDDFICYRPLGINWQPMQNGQLSMVLSPFPFLISFLVNDYAEKTIRIPFSEINVIYKSADLTMQAKTDYHNRKMEIYNKVKIIGIMPSNLKGRA